MMLHDELRLMAARSHANCQSGPCEEAATHVREWRTERMAASAFWYYCERHAADERLAMNGARDEPAAAHLQANDLAAARKARYIENMDTVMAELHVAAASLPHSRARILTLLAKIDGDT